MGNHLFIKIKLWLSVLCLISILCSLAPLRTKINKEAAYPDLFTYPVRRVSPQNLKGSERTVADNRNNAPIVGQKIASCVPVSTNNSQYINIVQFLGTLNEDTSNTTGFSSGGYGDFTGLPKKARQVPGGVVNLNVSVNDANGVSLSTTKAWVDWNQDGIFDQTATEKVYDLSENNVQSGNVIFGFIVPIGTPAGFYTIRIRASGSESGFDACGTIDRGEAEDYSFEVVDTCSATINMVTAQKRCGPGAVVLQATASANAVSYQWFKSEFGEPINGEIANSYTTSALTVGTHTYYVAAYNGSCYSTFRTPVKVVVSPTPEIQFSQSSPDICGHFNAIVINSSADKEEVNLLEEEFENTAEQNLLFENQSEGNPDENGKWLVRASPYIPTTPPYNVARAAISSGYEGGNFVSIITDVRQTTNIINHYVLKKSLNSTGFTDLKIDYSLYYFSEEDLESKNYLKLQYSLNNGDSWVDLKTYITDVGIPSRFQDETIALPKVCENQTGLQLRFSVNALGSDGEWMVDIVALDHIRIYGNREVPAQFIWSGNTTLFDGSCEGPPPAEGSPSICIKPTENEVLQNGVFNITAAATLANGCNLARTLAIANNTKIWNDSSSDWNTEKWKPVSEVPTANKCVIIKTPVTLNVLSDGFAKNVTVESTGKLQLNGNLTVGDGFVNKATDADVVIASDANLKQISDLPILSNTGNVTAKRNIKFKNSEREEYNYLISPVVGQSLKTLYPGVVTTSTYPYVLYHNEANNFFYNSSGAYIPGRGLAVKEPKMSDVPANNIDAVFKGAVANGTVSLPLAFTDNTLHAYNLAGNPYPSNIDLSALYTLNSGAITSTFYFWDNAANNITVQMGSNYTGRAYALYNASNGTGNEAGYLLTGNPIIGAKKPNHIVTVGQGFMVRARSSGKNLVFNNGVRVTDKAGAGFFSRTADLQADRYWLKLTSPENYVNTIAVVYYEGGSNSFGLDDSELNGNSSDMLYSLAEGHQLEIEGRPSFTLSDKIILGSTHFSAGNYTFSLGEKEGIFSSYQNIYLNDKVTGKLTNISESDYTFAATAGESTGRFEIVYKLEPVLATDGTVKENIIVYRDGSDFIIKAQHKKITSIEVFDGAGRLIKALTPNSLKAVISSDQMINGIYILKISQNGEITSKKIIH